MTPRPFVDTYTRPYTRGSPVMAAPVQPHWWASSLTRVHDAPASVERKMPRTPPIFALAYSAWYVAPGAALPKPMVSACSTPDTLVNVAPPSFECHRPYA